MLKLTSLNNGTRLLEQRRQSMKDGTLLSDLQRHDWASAHEIVSGPLLSDSYQALTVDAQQLISGLETTVDIGCTASDD